MRVTPIVLAAVISIAVTNSAAAQLGGDEPGSHPPAAASPTPPPPAKPIGPVRIASGVMQGLLIKRVAPVYPAGTNINGVVTLHVIIGTDGHVKEATPVAGPPMLTGAAVEAVRQWVYRPYLLNGQPSEVDTVVIVAMKPPRP